MLGVSIGNKPKSLVLKKHLYTQASRKYVSYFQHLKCSVRSQNIPHINNDDEKNFTG